MRPDLHCLAEFNPVPGMVKLKGGRKMKVLVRLGNAVGIHFIPERHVVAVMRLGRNPNCAIGSERF
jgi:hypothetical protein